VLPAAIAIAALLLAAALVYAGRRGLAFAASAVATLGLVATLFTSLYPRVMVSSPDFGNSLTVTGAASEHYTLAVLTVVAVILTPLILLYQGWTYYVFRARVTGGDLVSPADLLQSGNGSGNGSGRIQDATTPPQASQEPG
jgi:cytochrome d ubiquinol oxidase subunit II